MDGTRELLDLGMTEYHEYPAISSGFLRSFNTEGPWVAYHRYVKKELEKHDSDAMSFGRAFHLAMSDPTDWLNQLHIIPTEIENDHEREQVIKAWGSKSHGKGKMDVGTPINKGTNTHKAYLQLHKDHAEENEMEFISEDDIQTVIHAVGSVYDNTAAKEYVGQGGMPEKAGTIEEKATGLKLKALADLYLPDGHEKVIVDFKTTRHSCANTFLRDAWKRGYNCQAAHYLEVFGADRFVIISVRNAVPYEAMVYSFSRGDEIITEAIETNRRALEGIADCYDHDSWHTILWGSEIEFQSELGLQERYKAL